MALILDTGVVVAALNRDDRHHRRCRELLEGAHEMLLLPAPTLPEVDYWLSGHLGPTGMPALLDDIDGGTFIVEDLEHEDYARIREILETYADLDVGFVDAAVVAIVERLGEPKLATLDHRLFGAMRPRHADALELLPA